MIDLKHIWKARITNLSPSQRRLLNAIAREPTAHLYSKDYMARYQLTSGGIASGLRTLKKRALVGHEDREWRVQPPEMRKWLEVLHDRGPTPAENYRWWDTGKLSFVFNQSPLLEVELDLSPSMKHHTLALDLEGTLISNAVSAFPRPGLLDFLSFCRETFDRVVIFTSVPETAARRIMGILAVEGSAPAWFADLELFVCERHMQKDLERIGPPGDVWLVDDQEAYILPGQRNQWISIHEFMPPFTQMDEELTHVEVQILKKLSQSNERGH